MSAFTFGARLLAAATLAFSLVAAGVPAAAQTTGQIKGKVVDGKGQPVDKAVVTIEFKGGTNMSREVKTNKRGEFIQVGLQPGPYYVVVKADAGQAADQVRRSRPLVTSSSSSRSSSVVLPQACLAK